MPLNECRSDLRKLVTQIRLEPNLGPDELEESAEQPVIRLPVPESLAIEFDSGAQWIWLSSRSAKLAESIAKRFEGECVNGELEHLSSRQARQAFASLICECWLRREERPQIPAAQVARRFIESVRRAPMDWEVFWRVKDLLIDGPIVIGDVTLLPPDSLFSDHGFEDRHWTIWGLHDDKDAWAFARTVVRAGTVPKATERGFREIDDALQIFRVGLHKFRLIRDEQKRFRRDSQYAVRCISNPEEKGKCGCIFDHYAFDVGFREEHRELAQFGVDEFSIALREDVPAPIREPYRRAVLWAGSAITRTDWDDRIVDLCTALECLFTLKHDGRKAEAIALRYTLLAYATEDPFFAFHPLVTFDMYLLRNEIVHGSDRRVASEADCDQLEHIVMDALQRMATLINANPNFRNQLAIFEYLHSPQYLEAALRVTGPWEEDHESARLTAGLAREWQAPR